MINRVEKDYDSIDEKLMATTEVYLTTYQIVGKLGFKPKMVEICESVLIRSLKMWQRGRTISLNSWINSGLEIIYFFVTV
jgi:hypothetical protein